MDRTQLLAQFLRRTPLPGETVFLWRNGDQYHWKCVDSGRPLPIPGAGEQMPDAWLFYSGGWPTGDEARMRAHVDDMLDEMESMCGGLDRCRWPLDQPYPLHH